MNADKRSDQHRSRLGFYCLLLAIYTALFLGNFFVRGVSAIGINGAVFMCFLLGLYHTATSRGIPGTVTGKVLYSSMVLMSLSFALWENPFVSRITIVVLPLTFLFFIIWESLEHKDLQFWNSLFFVRMMHKIFLTPIALGSVQNFFTVGHNTSSSAAGIAKRVIFGSIVAVVLLTVIIIPLLRSADTQFDIAVEVVTQVVSFVEIGLRTALAVFAFFVLSMLTIVMCQKTKFVLLDGSNEKSRDSIIAGIILGSILVTYIIFLLFVAGLEWTTQLKDTFEETETFVKTGFWQLFFLSALNVILFWLYFKRTTQLVQYILGAFTLSSLLLVVTAGQKVLLYVYQYGLSYEKFFALYTVVYCIVLFCVLIFSLFGTRRTQVLQYVFLSALVFYSLATVLPVENIIIQTNILERENTRIDLYELRMLSPDVYGAVKNFESTPSHATWLNTVDTYLAVNNNWGKHYLTQGCEKLSHLERGPCETRYEGKEQTTLKDWDYMWKDWSQQQQEILQKKKWYEHSFGSLRAMKERP
jgi:hypothetical protein